MRKEPIHLLGYSTDSAGFSLSAAVHLMTPRAEETSNGLYYLGLGVDDEKFLAPYYWFLPAICYLDYDHEQRLFLKNLKYETRQLTFWREDGAVSRMAAVQHLKDLRQRCKERGLDSGLKATDLILIYFCDQNSDACERLFTERVADLLDTYIPGSQGTSLYIRTVFHWLEPFRKPKFGSPSDVQQSVSCGITILRLWRKVAELQKLRLHSKPGAKKTPENRGHFVTRGCYLTAEILFAAATLHQLAMFIHFPNEAGAWASPYNSGTKTTERIISELQGKTTELQSLDSQPTFGDMLDRSTKVQFNVNAKRRIAAAGIEVKSSSKRKQRAFAFKRYERPIQSADYREVTSYTDFREMQKEAHRKGVKDGEDLFEKYIPWACVDLLKKNSSWDMPYKFTHPSDLQLFDGELPENYNKLDLDVNVGSLVEEIAIGLSKDEDEDECREMSNDPESSLEPEQVDFEQEPEVNLKGNKWIVSKMENGKLSYIHISQAIKILLPREYIARCRQKRHWASKFLPGKEPLNPEHDIFLFGNVALKRVKEGVNCYLIVRVERVEAIKDGAEVLSFKLQDNPPVRLRCALYNRVKREDEYSEYQVGEDILLTPWRSACGILGPVELIPIAERSGSYLLHDKSKKWLKELGYVPFGEEIYQQEDATKISFNDHELEEGFYELEEVLGRRLRKDMTYEFQVRFKGYGPEDDMWLPASSFNRAVSFQTTSRFGRKRLHKTSEATAAHILEPPAKMPKSPRENRRNKEDSKSNKYYREKRQERDAPQVKKRNGQDAKPSKDNKAEEQALNAASEAIQSQPKNKRKRSKPKRSVRSCSSRKEKAKSFQSNLTKKEPRLPKLNPNVIILASDDSDIINSDNEDQSDIQRSILKDLCRRDVNFATPRRYLAEAQLPLVDQNIQAFTIESVTSKLEGDPCDPLTVDRVPPISVVTESMKELVKTKNKEGNEKFNFIVQYDSYGSFTQEGVRILSRFDTLRRVKREVQEEERWLDGACGRLSAKEKETVKAALLDRWNLNGQLLVQYKGFNITSQELSVLCCERYLTDEIINVLTIKYCDAANERLGRDVFAMLPTDISRHFRESAVFNLVANVDMSTVEMVFLPMLLHGNHWGLLVFNVRDCAVEYDDSFHYPVNSFVHELSGKTLKVIFETTGLQRFQQTNWNKVQRFRVPMPDQPSGSGSCGVGVVFCVRDLCKGFHTHFTWTFKETPMLRARLMIDLLTE